MQPLDARKDKRKPHMGEVERDFIALGITIAAIILFVGTGGPVVSSAVASFRGAPVAPNSVAASALLLNIALILFSWRRHGQLCREVAERRRAEEYARQLAETDALTGCINRHSLPGAVATLTTEAESRNEIVAFVMIDLDNFKQVNDQHGHHAGDVILQQAADRIRRLLPELGLLARLGGDEFLVAIPFPANRPDRVDHLATRIIEDLAMPYAIDAGADRISASLGLARSDSRREGTDLPADTASLLHMADIAMYQAKRRGRNRHVWFDPPMESELRFRAELEAGIRRGIPAGEFVPYYEQQIDIATGELTGFEMLARWHSPSLGVVSPEIFIPVAEEIGVIGTLSESLIAQALADARSWEPRLSLSVNISPIQLRDPWFAQKILKLLIQANFPPERLQIEITESCLHENLGLVRTLVTSLKSQGISISLDDFGTGYSSLSQIRALPFDRIKIDRSFVLDMADNLDNQTIVEAIAALGRGLGMPVTVEGVESLATLEKLQSLGSLNGQGYLYGEPETAEATRQRLAGMNLLAGPAMAEDCSPAPTPAPEPAPEPEAMPPSAAAGSAG